MADSEKRNCKPQTMPSGNNPGSGKPSPNEELFQDLFSGTEKRQREVIRSLGTELKICADLNGERKILTEKLIERYLTLPSKSSLKPYSLSYLDSCDPRIQAQVSELFVKGLEEKLSASEKSQRRILSDAVSRLLDCKVLSREIVEKLSMNMGKFLCWSLRSAREDSLATEDSNDFNDAMTDIKVTAHTLSKFLHKTHLGGQEDEKFIINDIMHICISVIKQENALLDCQTSCAMLLPLVYKILHEKMAVQLLMNDLFHKPREEVVTFCKQSCSQTYLCCLAGLLGGLDAGELTKTFQGSNILTLIAEKAFEVYDQMEGGDKSKYALSRCLVLFSSKMATCSANDLPNFQYLQKRLLEYVYSHLEDPVDAIRHQAKNVFGNVIQTHADMKRETSELVDLARDLVSMDWHRKGKYSLLAILTSHLETSVFLEMCPDLPSLMLTSLDEVGMANYVSDLYEKLLKNHKPLVSVEEWNKTWLDPVISGLSNPDLRQAIIVFILPKVLQATKSGIKTIIPPLIEGKLCGDSLLVLVTCLKRARWLGHLPQTENEDLWNDVLPFSVLNKALVHSGTEIRTEAFGLLCSNPKTTEIIPEYDLNLVLSYIMNNLTCQSPAMRKEFLTEFQRLLVRIKECWTSFLKRKCQEKASYYPKFVRGLYEGLIQCVYPGVSYTRRTTALSLLRVSVTVLSEVPQLPDMDSVATKAHVENLFQILTDTFEDNKAHALFLLCNIQSVKLGFDRTERIQEILDITDRLIVTTRPQDCATAAFLHRLLVQQPTFLQSLDSDLDDKIENRQLVLLKRLLVELKRQVEIGKKDLIHASVNAPMYPVLHCVRRLLSEVKVSNLDSVAWRDSMNELVELSFQSCTVVSPVISHSSPEGNVPVNDLIVGDDESLSTVEDMPEFLVVCSWRTVKEAALLLGDLSNWPVRTDEKSTGFVSLDLVFRIGQFYTDLLLESRHRGAFELAYAGFQPMCTMLWSSRLDCMNRLPSEWIKQIILDIKNSDKEGSRLCATRRSAGVPFYVLALVVTEPSNRGRKSFAFAMTELLEMAKNGPDASRIHALNCLRALYKDTRLGESVLSYVSRGIEISILGFSAENWSVRNASTLLFSALMARIFGVRREKNILSSKNCLSGRVFFYRYPALFPFILQQLIECTACTQTLNPGLYPVLMILGRLTPSILEGADTALNVSEFIPYVMRCAGSPVLKTRQMGAKALCPIVSKDRVENILNLICDSLERKSGSQNLIHGHLLQLSVLLEDTFLRKNFISEEILRRIFRLNWLMSRANPCYLTRAEYIQVVELVMDLVQAETLFFRRLLDEVLVVIHLEVAGWTPSNACGHNHMLTILVQLYLKHCDSFDGGRLLGFLAGHRYYEVREMALKYLIENEEMTPAALSKRLSKEQHPSCVAMLLDIFAFEKTEMNVGEAASLRHEVQCAKLRYLSLSENEEDRMKLISHLLEFSKPEQVFDIRMACADALMNIRGSLIERNPLQAQIWSVCMTLLLDEDDDVRERVCDVIGHVSSKTTDKAELCPSVALTRAVELLFATLSGMDCVDVIIELLRGPDAKYAPAERLFDRGEHSTYEDRIHLILLVVRKFQDDCRVAKFNFCEKQITICYKSIAKDFYDSLNDFCTSNHERFVQTGRFSGKFCENFGAFCSLFVLNTIRASLWTSEFEPSFNEVRLKYIGLFPTLMWPLTQFC